MEAKNNKYRIKVWHDIDAECPFLNWDCEPSVAWGYNKDIDGNFDSILKEIGTKLTEGIVKRYSKKILEIMDLCCEDYTYTEKVDEIFWQLPHLKIPQYAELCELLKIPYYLHSSRGYSQGDYCDVLIVLTAEDVQRVGFDVKKWTKDDKCFKNTAKLFDAWAWGDTYGFTIEELKKYTKTYEDGEIEEDEEWEPIDSCGGFYGYDLEENGMLEHITDEYNIDLDNDIIRE